MRRHSIDRQADAVDRDRPFGTSKRPNSAGTSKSKDGKLALLFNRRDRADTIHMAR